MEQYGYLTVYDAGHEGAKMVLDKKSPPVMVMDDGLDRERGSAGCSPCSVGPLDAVYGTTAVHTSCPKTLPFTTNNQLVYNFPTRLEATVGPVIGAVTSTAARVLVELNGDSMVTVTAIARAASDQRSGSKNPLHISTASRQFYRGIPAAVALTELRPDTLYTLQLSVPTPRLVTSSFRTRPCDTTTHQDTLEIRPLRCGIVSGHIGLQRSFAERADPKASKKNQPAQAHSVECGQAKDDEEIHKSQRLGRALWKDIYRRVYRHELDLLIHLGNLPHLGAVGIGHGAESNPTMLDEVTHRILNVFHQALIVLQYAPSERHAYSEICELFRWVYRTSWNGPFIKHVLANVPNYMMMNEAEFGRWYYPHPQTENHSFVVSCAYEVYLEYTKNLVEDYAPRSYAGCRLPAAVHMCYKIGSDVALMLMDLKVCKGARILDNDTDSKSKQPDRHRKRSKALPHLGFAQWGDLIDDLKPGGRLKDVRFLLISTQQRLSDPASSWFHKDHLAETYHFLRCLFAWKRERPYGHRTILLVANEASSTDYGSGVADIIMKRTEIDQSASSYDYADDPRQYRIREFSCTGMGHTKCLRNIPSLSPRGPLTTLPRTSKTRNVLVDRPTYYTAEGDLNTTTPVDLRDFRVSKSVKTYNLGKEFQSLQYKQAEINGYGLVTVDTCYMLPQNQRETDANARNPIWAQYIARPSVKTQLIGAQFSGDIPPLPGLIYFPLVLDTQSRIPDRSCASTV